MGLGGGGGGGDRIGIRVWVWVTGIIGIRTQGGWCPIFYWGQSECRGCEQHPSCSLTGLPCASPVGFMGVGRQRCGQSAQVRVRGTVVWGSCLVLSLPFSRARLTPTAARTLRDACAVRWGNLTCRACGMGKSKEDSQTGQRQTHRGPCPHGS